MKEFVLNFIYKIRVLLVVLICLFGVSMFYIASGSLAPMLVNVLNLKVDPTYVGGEVEAEFFDATEDLLYYTVHRPVFNARWQKSADYWQIDFALKEYAVKEKEVLIYIGLENETSRDFTVHIFGDKGKVYDSDGNFIYDIELYYENNGEVLKIRIPLADKRLQKVFLAKETYHQVYLKESSEVKKPETIKVEMKWNQKKSSKK